MPKDLQALIISNSNLTSLAKASSILRNFLGNGMDSLPNKLKSFKLYFNDYLTVLELCNRAKLLIKRFFNCSAKECEIRCLLLAVLRAFTFFIQDWLKYVEVVNLDSLKHFELANCNLLTRCEHSNKIKSFTQPSNRDMKIKVEDKSGFLVSSVPK